MNIYISKTIDGEGTSSENRTSEALLGYQGSTKLWIGKDYTNFIVKDFIQLDQPLQGSERNLVILTYSIKI